MDRCEQANMRIVMRAMDGLVWGVGPTGRQIEVPTFGLSRVLDGRIVEQ